MRIYDSDSDKKLSNIILYLTPDEAREIKDSLETLISDSSKVHHEHIPDREDNFKREITVCIYREDNLSSFDEHSQKIILDNE